jgi:hypothetical protein
MQVARPGAEHGEAGRVNLSWLDVYLGARPPSAPQQLVRGEQPRLPPLRADDIAEHGFVVALAQPVTSAVLEVCHPSRKLVDRLDLGMDDHPVPHYWPNHGPSAFAKQVDEQL